MQTLANGVGDLKRVLSNVKTRGGWGEVQLESILEQIFTAEQFSRQVATKPGSRETVDCANRLPGRSEEHTSELQSLRRNSSAVFCLPKRNTKNPGNSNDSLVHHRLRLDIAVH